MVDVLGHLGMAFVWLAPVWFLQWRPRTTAAFVLTCTPFGMLPDVDLYVSNVLRTVHHHGVFHTVLAVTLLSAVLGPATGRVLHRLLDGRAGVLPDGAATSPRLWFAGVWTAALSHLFADMLSAPDTAPPIEPLWPLYDGNFASLDVFYFTSPLATYGLFAVGVLLNLALYGYTTRG